MNKLLLLVASAAIVLTSGCKSTAEDENVAATDSQKVVKRCTTEKVTGSRVPKRYCRTGTQERLDEIEAEENKRLAQIEMDRARNAISAQGVGSNGR